MKEINKSYDINLSNESTANEPISSYTLEVSPFEHLIQLLGLTNIKDKLRSTLDLLTLTESGFPISVLKKLQKHTKFTNREMGLALDMSESTLQRRLRDNQKLDKKQSESAVQLASVWAKGIEVFEDEEDFRTWLHADNQALGGNKPVSIIGSSIGREEIKQILGRIEWGIYS